MEDIMKDWDELVKIPPQSQNPDLIGILNNRLKEIKTIFFDKARPASERNEHFDEHNKIAGYLNVTALKWKAQDKKAGGSHKQARTVEEKKKDIKDMLEYCLMLRNQFVENNISHVKAGTLTQIQVDILGGQILNNACNNWNRD